MAPTRFRSCRAGGSPVGIPASVIEAPLHRLVLRIVALGGATLLLSALLASSFTRGISRPLTMLADAAVRLGRGEAVPALETGLREADEVALTLREAAAEMWERERAVLETKASLAELNETLERRIERAIAERDRIWRLSTDLMLVARFDGEVLAVNPAWTNVLGWRRRA